MCKNCFDKSDHKGHDILEYKGRGFCDCGNPKLWDQKGFCQEHGGPEYQPQPKAPSKKNELKKEIYSGKEYDLDVFKYHNEARTNPKSFIPLLEEMLTKFEGTVLKRPELDTNLQTKEGPAAVHELIQFLKDKEPMDPIEW